MIFEDPDELGYFTDQQMAKARRPAPVSNINVFDGLLSEEERAEITQAAFLEHNGYRIEAEQHRRWGGYDATTMLVSADRPIR